MIGSGRPRAARPVAPLIVLLPAALIALPDRRLGVASVAVRANRLI
jgi:hypothetical protein